MSNGDPTVDFEKLNKQLGGIGKFQLLALAITCYCTFCAGLMVVTPVYSSKTDNYRCYVPNCDTNDSVYLENYVNFTLPWNEKSSQFDQCLYYSVPDQNNASCIASAFQGENQTKKCSKWIYDRSLFHQTTVTEFELTCERSWLIPLESSCYMVGMLVGSILIGYISDIIGRRAGILISAIAYLIGGALGAASYNYTMFLGCRVLAGIGGCGLFSIPFVIAIEYVSSEWKTFFGILVDIPFGLGECFYGLLAYFIRDWRYLHAASTIPVVIVIFGYFLMPESMRWLVSKGRIEQTHQVIKRAAKVNKVPVPKNVFRYDDTAATNNSKKNSLWHLLRSPTIRKRNFVLYYCWFVVNLIYYGLSSYASKLAGNTFINFTAITLIEMPSYIFAYFLFEKVGRKCGHIFTFILGGVSCIISSLLSPDRIVLIVCMSLLGKMGASAAFGGLWLYTGELFPTEYRAIGVGTCAMFARFGGIVAPFINATSAIYKSLPSMIFGLLSILAGLSVFLLPETLDCELPQTIEECEQFGRNQPLLTFGCCRKRRSKSQEEDNELS